MNGCDGFRQKIGGSFNKPATDRLLVPVSPLLKALDKAKTLLPGADCECEML